MVAERRRRLVRGDLWATAAIADSLRHPRTRPRARTESRPRGDAHSRAHLAAPARVTSPGIV